MSELDFRLAAFMKGASRRASTASMLSSESSLLYPDVNLELLDLVDDDDDEELLLEELLQDLDGML